MDRAPRQQEGGLVPVPDRRSTSPRRAGPTRPRLRNPDVTGDARAQLVIDPGPRSDRRPRRAGAGVPLRHRHVPRQARLPGRAAHRRGGAPARPRRPRPLVLADRRRRSTTFANNDGWHDDTSDGPVTATVTLDGRDDAGRPGLGGGRAAELRARARRRRAHALRPALRHLRRSRLAARSPSAGPFTRDVFPILRAARGSAVGQPGLRRPRSAGAGANDFLRPRLPRAAAPARPPEHSGAAAARSSTRSATRLATARSPVPWPWLYGDAMSLPPTRPASTSRCRRPSTRLLERWAAGDFDAGLDLDREPPRARGRAARRAARDAGPRRARLLPGRRVPPRLRGDLADAPRLDVLRAVPDPRTAPTAARARATATSLTPQAALARRRAALRRRPGRPHALDGGAVAGRHRELPLRLRLQVRPLSADVLARARAQPRDARTRLRDHGGRGTAAGRAPRGLRDAGRTGYGG